MTAVTKIVPALPREPFLSAIRDVNEWRGRCLHLFAEAELAVSGCLQTLSQVPERGKKIRRRHLIGQRYEDLANALSADGPFENEGKKVLEALRAIRELDATRAMLCHGASEVTLDSLGGWTAVFRHFTFGAGASVEEVRVVTQSEATALQKELRQKVKRLCSQLSTLVASLK